VPKRIGLFTREQIIELDSMLDFRGLKELFDRALIRRISKKLEERIPEEALPTVYFAIDTLFQIIKEEKDEQ
jgi:hypothetical protein